MLDLPSPKVIKYSVEIFEKHILAQLEDKSVLWACILQLKDMMATALVGIKSHEYLNLLCQSGLDFFLFQDFGVFQHSFLSACRVTSKTKVKSPAFQDINRLIVPRGKGT